MQQNVQLSRVYLEVWQHMMSQVLANLFVEASAERPGPQHLGLDAHLKVGVEVRHPLQQHAEIIEIDAQALWIHFG